MDVLFLERGSYQLVMRAARGQVATSRLLSGFSVSVDSLWHQA